MEVLAGVLVIMMAAQPPADPSADPIRERYHLSEGPVSGPTVALDTGDPNDWWHRRDRRLRNATIGLGAVVGAMVVATAVTGALANQANDGEHFQRREDMTLAAVISGSIGVVTLAPLIGTGSALAVYRERGWQPRPDLAVISGKVDPRLDPRWVERDRKLRRGTIGTGAFAGAMWFGLALALVIPRTLPPPCDGCFTEGFVSFYASVITGTLAGAGTIAFAGVGGAWAVHRKPLRRWQAALAPGGLQIRF